jgi:hypothetical protein
MSHTYLGELSMNTLLRLLLFDCLAGSVLFAQDETSQLVEQRLSDLRKNSATPALDELPTDQSPIPADWLSLVSWNVQVGGVSTSPSALRPPMPCRDSSREPTSYCQPRKSLQMAIHRFF